MKHPGFKKVQSKIQGEGYSKEQAGAILANASRKASPSAKKANPNLKRVKMGRHDEFELHEKKMAKAVCNP